MPELWTGHEDAQEGIPISGSVPKIVVVLFEHHDMYTGNLYLVVSIHIAPQSYLSVLFLNIDACLWHWMVMMSVILYGSAGIA